MRSGKTNMAHHDKHQWELVCTEEQERYLAIHSRRFDMVLDLVRKYSVHRDNFRLLDIGPSVLTRRIKDEIAGAQVECLGITGEKRDGGHLPSPALLEGIKLIDYDLNSTIDSSSWPVPEPYQIIVIAEVIEHLHIAPEYLLRFLRSILKPGGFIILQTPNAVSLIKRIRMLQGKNPYEMIRTNYENPGHFREYTMQELRDLVQKENFRIEEMFCGNYFNIFPGTLKLTVYQLMQRILGRNFKDGITAILTA